MGTITGYGSKHSHEFKLTVNETSTNTANNTSEVSFSFTIYKASYSWSNWNNITYSISINGTSYTGTIPSYSAGSTMTIRSGNQTVGHEADGTMTIGYSFSVNDSSGQNYTCGNASASGSMTLTTLARYADINSAYVESTGLTTAVIKYSVSRSANIFCSVDGQVWGNPRVSNTTSGTFTISNLSPNTKHSFRVLARATSSGLDRFSDTFYGTTKDIARISTLSNFNHGDNASVSITNPASISSLSLVMKIGDAQILSRTAKAGSNTITFSDTELDNIYKKYGSGSSVTATFVVSGSGYTNSKTCTITFKRQSKNYKN